MQRQDHPTARVAEVLEFLRPHSCGIYVDGTIGPGGHSEAILKSVVPPPMVVGIDRDREMLALAAQRLAEFGDRVRLVWGRHGEIDTILSSLGIEVVDGVVLDVGPAWQQLLDPARGMRHDSDQLLDARYDRTQPLTAFRIVNEYSQEQLAEVLAITGRKREARRIAAEIVRRRKDGPIRSPREFAEIVQSVVGRGREKPVEVVAPFIMALRSWVNEELAELERGIEGAVKVLRPGGRVVVLTWDSSQHRVARKTLQRLARGCICPPELPCTCGRRPAVKLLTPRGLPTPPEQVAAGPATLRTCRLFAAERLPEEH